jgi:hypothetical protein
MAQPTPGAYPEDGPLELVQGDVREFDITWPDTYDVDFTTGHTFLSQVRATRSRTATLLATFTVTATGARTLHFLLPEDEADALTTEDNRAWWDVQVRNTADSAPRTWVANKVKIIPDVSHA